MDFLDEFYQARTEEGDDDPVEEAVVSGRDSAHSLEDLFAEEGMPEPVELSAVPKIAVPKIAVHYTVVCVDRGLGKKVGPGGEIMKTMRRLFAARPCDPQGNDTEVVKQETHGRDYTRFDMWTESNDVPSTLITQAATAAIKVAARMEYNITRRVEFSFALGVAAEKTLEGCPGSRIEIGGNMDLYAVMRHALKTAPEYFYVPSVCLDRVLRPLTPRETMYWHMAGAKRAKEMAIREFRGFFQAELSEGMPRTSTVFRSGVVKLDRALRAAKKEEEIQRKIHDLKR